MIKTNKEIVKLETIKTLANLFPKMTILELLEWFEYCNTLNKEVTKNDYQKNEVGTLRHTR